MATVDVTMPKMGESITEGTIIAWHKQPGDHVDLDETILEIGTDKVDTEVPSPAEGTLKEHLVAEGDTVDVGTRLAVIDTDGQAATDAASANETASAPPPEDEPRAETASAQEEAPAAETPSSAPPEEGTGEAGGERIDVVMPKMGESIMEGTIIAWHKKPGDAIELDETLLEIATDKVDTEVPSPVAGTVVELLYEEGDTVEVNERIAVISTGAAAPASPASAAPRSAAPKPAAPKANAAALQSAPAPVAAEPVPDPAFAPPAESSGPVERQGESGRFYSPLVRSIAEKEGVSMAELERIDGTGREGRVSKADLLGYIEQRKQGGTAAPPVQPPPAAPAKAPQPSRSAPPAFASTTDSGERVEIVEMDRMRQIIAAHMIRSKATSAHVTSFAEADVTNLVRLRERNKDAFLKREGVKLTFTPFFVQAAVEALKEHPFFNASVEEQRIIVKKDLHIGIAVALGKSGLIAPVIRNAGDKNLIGLAKAAADLAERARSKALQPDEIQGGTFTLTNIGSLGSIMGTPIINQPQVAILATGAIKKRPAVIENPYLGDVIAVRHMMYLSLSYDHRIIDGAMGSSFLRAFVDAVEALDPTRDL